VPAGELNAGAVPRIVAESVKYNQKAPWDPLADGTGWSLQRINPLLYGNDPANWRAGAPSPGPQINPLLDSDGDGIPDVWEIAYGLDPFDPTDAYQDPDHDGMTNLQEYLAGTAPNDSTSVFRLVAVSMVPTGSNTLDLGFMAEANRSYSIEWANQILPPTTWSWFANVETAPTNRWVHLSAPLSAAKRFYRVVTPGMAYAPGQMQIQSASLASGWTNMVFSFEAAPNTGYVVEAANQVPSTTWSPVLSVPAAPTNRVIECSAPISAASRFFRLRTAP
jgi:hypothetical protein